MCARDIGMYLSFFAVTYVIYFLRARAKKRIRLMPAIALILIAPLFLDWLTQTMGLRESTNMLRFATGILAGSGEALLPYLLIEGEMEKLKKMLIPFSGLFVLSSLSLAGGISLYASVVLALAVAFTVSIMLYSIIIRIKSR